MKRCADRDGVVAVAFMLGLNLLTSWRDNTRRLRASKHTRACTHHQRSGFNTGQNVAEIDSAGVGGLHV